jgi:hypothetical protein
MDVMFYTDNNSTPISQANVTNGDGSTLSMDWQPVHNWVRTPADATIMKIVLTSQNTSGWIAFDDVSVTQPLPSATKYYFLLARSASP